MTARRGSRPAVLAMGSVLLLAMALSLMLGSQVLGVDHRYDCSSIWSDHPDVWNALNDYETGNGHYMAMGSDVKRDDILAEGNFPAEDWEGFVTAYYEGHTDASAYADLIISTANNSDHWDGNLPGWILINEINKDPDYGLTWGGANDSATYRNWVINVCARLDDYYGKYVCIFSPWQNPNGNNASWQALDDHAFIGVECYLSGQEIAAQSYSTSWCQTQYQNSKDSYLGRGVPASRIFLLEHFAHNTSGSGCGRSGLAAEADWALAIQRRCAASHNVDFNGFVSYAWLKNQMGAAEWALIDAAETYGACQVH